MKFLLLEYGGLPDGSIAEYHHIELFLHFIIYYN